jgi:arylsulfatase A-like enzyme
MTSPPNILLLIADQDRHFPDFPQGYRLPGRARLQESGTTFTNHQITSCVCTPSRSTIYMGQHIQRTGVFDNVNFPWSNDLPLDQPTVGHRLRDLGYYTAYMGKWHLSAALAEGQDPLMGSDPAFGRLLEQYGFADFISPGDGIGGTLGGYHHDELIGAAARRWLRMKPNELTAKGKPWFLAVNLVNPHDVMHLDTDRPGEPVQMATGSMFPTMPPPDTPWYSQSWDIDLPSTRHEPWDLPGRPTAHREYQEARRYLAGLIPDEDWRWKTLLDFYLNCIRAADRQVEAVLSELADQGLDDNTVVIYSSDHGELGGAHGMSGKGATAFREQVNVPLVISHPDLDGGSSSDALTSHLDLVPTIIGLTGLEADTDDLPGKDIGAAMSEGTPGLHDLRDGTLYAFNMFTLLDAGFIKTMAELRAAGKKPDSPPQFDFSIRGAIRSVYDGRFRFSRYFANTEHHRPETVEDLLARNDVELFDHQADPDEAHNLAVDPVAAAGELLAANALMNRLIEEEVGVDDGSFLPIGTEKPWEVERWDV